MPASPGRPGPKALVLHAGLGFLLVGCLASSSLPAAAQTAPRTVRAGDAPLPPPRPVLPGDPPAAETSAGAEQPGPPPRPPGLQAVPTAAPSAGTALSDRPPESDDAPCLARLKEIGVQFEALPALAEGACGATRPLKVSRLPDDIAIGPPATMVCGMAEALAQWSRTVVVPEAKRLLSARPATIAIGTSYQCRTRNHQPGAKLSEHAFANAVDVSGITFHDRAAVTIGTPAADTPEGRYAAAIQAGACPSFWTVLGPGSDVEHGNHLHLDLRWRRNNYRICQ